MAEVTYLEAIRMALREELARDPDVFLMGEDIGVYGGVFKVTTGLQAEFGAERVIDTPLSEEGFTGAAVGAAMMGMKPVVEIQFADFLTVCVDPIVTLAAKSHWRYRHPVPLVVRTPFGGGTSGGPFHCGSPEGLFLNVPGLKIVAPSNPYDAKGLLKAAIRDPDPVLYFEHKYLYRRLKAAVPDADYVVEIGRAAVARPGRDLSIISYGATLVECLTAAEQLAAEGIDCEVLDLRTLLPLDREAILATVRRTSKILIAGEQPLTGSLSGEISALIAEHAFDWLDGPIVRVGAPDTPVPYAPALEEAYLPRAPRIAAAARQLARY
jgi:2-oxoisovalerate dehydrogenase E1 component beta subunit